MQALVLDTNIVLALLVFRDPSAAPLQAGLEQRRLRWLATPAMRGELERVLGYRQIAARLAAAGRDAGQVLQFFDRHACLVDAPARAPLTCRDSDDQGFIDLAVHHRCSLLSKDGAVLALSRRLAAIQVNAGMAIPACSYSLGED
jgi:predicted nucleic acid-binding protein